jgi:uncharacterized protein (DUF58 family)
LAVFFDRFGSGENIESTMSQVSRFLNPALIERLNHLQLSSVNVAEGSLIGQHRSPRKGASVEFRQHRFYTSGDEPRRLDWRLLARTDRPYVKEYEQESNLRCILALDASGSMGYGTAHGSKFDYAAQIVAALGYLMLNQSESVGLAICRDKVQSWLGPRSGSGQLSRMIGALERSDPTGPSSIGAVQEIANRLDRRALVVFISDFFQPVAQVRRSLARLRHDRHDVMLVRVLDADELEFPFRRWTRFAGLEGEASAICEPAMMRQSYHERFARHRMELESAAGAMGSQLHTLITRQPMIDSLTRLLRIGSTTSGTA